MSAEPDDIAAPLNICGEPSPGGEPVLLCSYSPHKDGPHSWSLRQREGDQPLPVHRAGEPDIQSIAIMDLRANHALPVTEQVVAMIEARRRLGIARYGSALQAFNGRDAGQDLLEELVDALVYACQLWVETARTDPDLSARYLRMYEAIVHLLQGLATLRSQQGKL